MAETPQLLQARVNAELMARYTTQRERWGMSNQEFIERILLQALPIFEALDGPPPAQPAR